MLKHSRSKNGSRAGVIVELCVVGISPLICHTNKSLPPMKFNIVCDELKGQEAWMEASHNDDCSFCYDLDIIENFRIWSSTYGIGHMMSFANMAGSHVIHEIKVMSHLGLLKRNGMDGFCQSPFRM